MADQNTLAEVNVEVRANLDKLAADFAKAKQQAQAHERDMKRLTAGEWRKIHEQRLGKVTDERVAASRRAADASRRLESQYLAEARANQRLVDQSRRHTDAMRNELLLTNRLSRASAARAVGGGGGGGPIVPIVPIRDARREVGGLSQSLGLATLAMRGFIGAVGIGLVTQMASGVTNVIKATAAIEDQARAVGLTSTQYQEWLGVGLKLGIEQEKMARGLAEFAENARQAAAGSDREEKVFKRLGVSLKDAQGNARGFNDILRDTVGRLGQVHNPLQRGAALAFLFSEAVGPEMAPLIDLGITKIDELRAALHELGMVQDEETIKKADETAKKLDALNVVLSNRVASTVVENADAIVTLANAIASIIGVALQGASALAKFFSVASQPMPEIGGRSGFGFGLGLLTNPAGAIGRLGFDLGTGRANSRQSRPSASVMLPPAGKSTPKTGGIDLSGLFDRDRKGRKGGGGRQAPVNVFDREEAQVAQERLRLLKAATVDLTRRNEIEQELISWALKEKFAQIDRQVKSGQLTAAQAKKLKGEEEANAQLEREAANREMRIDMIEQSADRASEILDAESNLLQASEVLARTEDERTRIAASLLRNRQDQELLEIDKQIELAKQLEDEKRITELTDMRKRLLERQAVETKGFAVEQLRGMEKFRNDLPKTVAEINEQIENIRFDLFTQKLQEAAQFARSLGDAFGQAAGEIARTGDVMGALTGLLNNLAQTLTEQFIEKPIAEFFTEKVGGPLAKKTIGKDLVGPDALTVQQMNMALDLATANLRNLSIAAGQAAGAMGAGGGAGAAGAADALTQAATGTEQSFSALDPQLSQFGSGLMQVLSSLAGGGGGSDLMGFLKMGLSIAGAAAGGGGGLPFTPSPGGAGSGFAGYVGIGQFMGGMAEGGWVGGHGTGRSDSNLIRASVGEHMTNADAASRFGPVLDGINSGRIPDMPSLGRMMGGNSVFAPRVQFGDMIFPGIRDAREARRASRQLTSDLQHKISRGVKAGYRQQS